MTPIVFGYVVVFTLLLAGAAAALEWGTRGRVASRHVWTGAILLTILAPPSVLLWHAHTEPLVKLQTTASRDAGEIITTLVQPQQRRAGDVAKAGGVPATVLSLFPSRASAARALSRLNDGLAGLTLAIWVLLSAALLGWLSIGVFRWHRAQREWLSTTVDGVDVHVSASTGPAVLGLVSQRIVLPIWATTMQPEHRRLVLAHECEHISANDPQRLALGLAALILMPWNIGLWWCTARLRRAIELDCDARVLRRFPSTKEYGYVLLEVATRSRRAGALAIPMVGLLRLSSELELRLRAMTRCRTGGIRGILAGGIIAIGAVSAAFTAPVPAVRIDDGQAGRALPLHVRMSYRDTVPKTTIDTLVARSPLDSVRMWLLQVQQKSLELAATRAQLEAAAAALRAAELSVSLPDSLRSAIEAARSRVGGIVETNINFAMRRHAPPSPRELKHGSEESMRTRGQIDSAIAHTYPDLAAHPNVPAVLWFVVDSAGRVIHSKRDAEIPSPRMTAGSARAQLFVGVRIDSIASVTEMKKMDGHSSLSVTWIRLKGKTPD